MVNTQRGCVGERRRLATQRMRRRVLSSHEQFWHVKDFDAPASTVQHLLNTLVSAGDLRRVRRGLYWRGVKTALGMSPPPNGRLVRELARGAGVGPAGASAANALRLSTQVPRYSLVAVPGRKPADAGTIRFVSRAARSGRRTAGLNGMEVALLETLDGWEQLLEVSPDEGWQRLLDLVTNDTVRPDRLARASRTEPAAVRIRLAALLDDAGCAGPASRVPTADRRTVAAARGSTPAGTDA